jgi:hypothetical protein
MGGHDRRVACCPVVGDGLGNLDGYVACFGVGAGPHSSASAAVWATAESLMSAAAREGRQRPHSHATAACSTGWIRCSSPLAAIPHLALTQVFKRFRVTKMSKRIAVLGTPAHRRQTLDRARRLGDDFM